MENTGLIGDILALVGVFFLGFVAGMFYAPLRRLVSGAVKTPGKLFKGAQSVSTKLLQALSAAEDEIDQSSLSQALSNTVSGVLTFGVRQAETAFREGMEAFEQGDHGAARRKLGQALFWDRKMELAPLHVSAHLSLGLLDEEKGGFEGAKKHYQRSAQLDANNVQAAARLGMAHFRLKENGAAIFQFQRALELDPSNLDTHYYLYTVYREARMENEAVEQLRIIKAGESSEKLVELFARHGVEHFRLGAYAEALADYELALQLGPHSVPLYTSLGDLYYLSEQPHTALETWCRGLWEGYSDALAERVLAVSGEAADIWSVITLARDCANRHSREGRYGLLLSRLLRQARAEDEGIVRLEEAARQSPQLLEAQMELGEIYSGAGDVSQALQVFRRGLEAARDLQTVFRCHMCGYVSSEDQPRCFECNRWGTFVRMSRAESNTVSRPSRSLLLRAGGVRYSLQSAWSKVRGQLPSGKQEQTLE
jgi:tetratricopeptide (TPR) repeat protein